ncbi:uncharacterized protein LOC125046248 [Penaeus chinensis]|uniref:uncharacterized protein LOC125046248 n=1 Tax=Penaeus chinensis TaxID=139456 RepID=UPI001FB664A6|nr:uncharacterized protein LOC125046248 [Penaeus chinensis]XP_047499974.1 uncharacterized protein LOC125046248 [Penaeus chinensis]XP_047499975.1 uncharacterized protein LOC125046248 [Penaeus chinensis]XP_047499976.1 uncharacterized protein LOC125046248 [Penaeus chinensis]XP_047499977.1 uncharacterized protein LOC125046248 [Penaeus chinensis]XP_047499978.1 uncharacterized protein LOC125046248 [Penaeus chinensis]
MMNVRMMMMMPAVVSVVLVLPAAAGSIQENAPNVWKVSQGDRLRVELEPSQASHDLLLTPLTTDAEPFLSFVDEHYVTPSYTGKLCDPERRLCHVALNRTFVIVTEDDGARTIITVKTICGVKPLMKAEVRSGYPLGVVVGGERGTVQAVLNVTTSDHMDECPKVMSSSTAPIVIGIMLLVVAVGVVGFVVYGRKKRDQGVPVESEEVEKPTPESENLQDKEVV